MVVRPRAVLVATALAALVVFAVVQDRVTADGARRYVAIQRAAIAGRAQPVTVDEIMRPAIARSVRQGLTWAGLVVAAGIGVAIVAHRANGANLTNPANPEPRIPNPGRGHE